MTARRALVAVLLFALVTAQTLGLVHQGAHGQAQNRHVAAAGPASIQDDGYRGGLASLLGTHEDEAACLLFDQLGHGASFGLTAAAVPALVAALFLLPLYDGAALARRAALFEARGPPSSR